MRKAIPIEKQVAVALWRMSTGNSIPIVSKTFTIRKSTEVTIICEVCTEIFILSPQFLKFPISQLKTEKTIENFKEDCDFIGTRGSSLHSHFHTNNRKRMKV